MEAVRSAGALTLVCCFAGLSLDLSQEFPRGPFGLPCPGGPGLAVNVPLRAQTLRGRAQQPRERARERRARVGERSLADGLVRHTDIIC